jgi:hypothetical protein
MNVVILKLTVVMGRNTSITSSVYKTKHLAVTTPKQPIANAYHDFSEFLALCQTNGFLESDHK